MLEQVNLKQKLSKKEYKQHLPDWQERLYELEKTCWDRKIPSIIVLEGWDGSGKGAAVNTLTEKLDARGFKLHPIRPFRTRHKQYPWMRRFWLRVPSDGEMAIFDRSWYRRVLDDRVGKQIRKREWRAAYRDITGFERMLADDGAVIVKFWLHISKKEQRKRFRKLEKDPLEAWRVTEADWERHHQYEDYLVAAEEMFERTESEWGPWTIVEAHDRWYARAKLFTTIIAALERRVGS